MKIRDVDWIRIIVIGPCILCKVQINNILGLNACLRNIGLPYRLVYEIVTLFGVVFIVGYLEYIILKISNPVLLIKIKKILEQHSMGVIQKSHNGGDNAND